jgi:hypothetical protein
MSHRLALALSRLHHLGSHTATYSHLFKRPAQARAHVAWFTCLHAEQNQLTLLIWLKSHTYKPTFCCHLLPSWLVLIVFTSPMLNLKVSHEVSLL